MAKIYIAGPEGIPDNAMQTEIATRYIGRTHNWLRKKFYEGEIGAYHSPLGHIFFLPQELDELESRYPHSVKTERPGEVRVRKRRGNLISIGEASRILHISKSTLRNWDKQGLIRTYRVGSRGDRCFRHMDVMALAVDNETYQQLHDN